MPNRILHGDILTSRQINRLKPQAELFFRRLWSVVDDFGRFHADATILRASCYPLRTDEVREADISRWLAEVQTAGLIALYAVDEVPYLEVPAKVFRQQVRASKSQFPAPPAGATQTSSGCVAAAQQMIPETETETESKSEAKTGECEGGSRPPAPPARVGGSPRRSAGGDRSEEPEGFADFWGRYPRKEKRPDAEKAWKRLPASDREAALLAVVAFAEVWGRAPQDRRAFIPHPGTWLRNRRWEDARSEWERAASAPSSRPAPVPIGAHSPSKAPEPDEADAERLPAPLPTPDGPENVLPAILDDVRQEIDEREFADWVKPLRQAGPVNGHLDVVAPTITHARVIRGEYLPAIAVAALQHGINVTIRLFAEDGAEVPS